MKYFLAVCTLLGSVGSSAVLANDRIDACESDLDSFDGDSIDLRWSLDRSRVFHPSEGRATLGAGSSEDRSPPFWYDANDPKFPSFSSAPVLEKFPFEKTQPSEASRRPLIQGVRRNDQTPGGGKANAPMPKPRGLTQPSPCNHSKSR
jgi:hypothetical protein